MYVGGLKTAFFHVWCTEVASQVPPRPAESESQAGDAFLNEAPGGSNTQ